ncbi:MAG: DUF5685 family protein [Verrucomicrobiota bacterium]
MTHNNGNACGRDAARRSYCGTCKTIGRSFGQTQRFTLNHDIAFFGEMLRAVSKHEETDAAYSNRSCFALPDSGSLDPAYEMAACINLVMAEIQIRDHTEDSGGSLKWKLPEKLVSRSAEKAAKRLEDAGVSTAVLRGWAESQVDRELEVAGRNGKEDPSEQVSHVAQPTREMTAMVLRAAVSAIGRPDLVEPFGHFGESFGQLIYILDAYEDFSKDTQKRQFNAIREGYEIEDVTMPRWIRTAIETQLRELVESIETSWKTMGLEEEMVDAWRSRLQENLEERLRRSRPIAFDEGAGVRGRWKMACEMAKGVMVAKRARIYPVLRFPTQVVMTMLAFIAPAQSVRAGTTPVMVASFGEFVGCLCCGLFVFGACANVIQKQRKAERTRYVSIHRKKTCCCFPNRYQVLVSRPKGPCD